MRIFTNKSQFVPILVAVFVLILAGCGGAQRSPGPSAPKVQLSLAPQTTQPNAPPNAENLPPTLVATSPVNGSTWAGGPVVFRFDQPMAEGVADHFSTRPELAGQVSVEGNEVIFTPDQMPEANTRYQLILDPDAESSDGVALGAPVAISLVGAGPLAVTSTQPSDGSEDVSTETRIVVVFNRPVVPLTAIDAAQPNPLAITPPVEGEGAWINTSVYSFQPATRLAGATRYDVVVDGISGLGGETLVEPFQFGFATASPIVTSFSPIGRMIASPTGEMAPPDAQVVVVFSQAMEPASTEAAFSVRPLQAAPDEAIAGEIEWDDDHTALTFTPASPLKHGESYLVQVAEDARSASGQGTLREPYSNSFNVVPTPMVNSVSPFDGETNVDPERVVTIQFNTPVSATSVLENIQISPPITNSYVYSYYAEWNNELQMSWFKDANTRYTITVGADVVDDFGNTLDRPYLFSFTTGDYAPFARLNLDRFTHFSAYTDTRASVLYRNLDSVDVSLYRLPVAEFLKLTGQNQWEVWEKYQVPDPQQTRLWTRNYEPIVGVNVAARQVITLTDAAGQRLTPGFYLLEVDQPATDPQMDIFSRRAQSLIVLGNNNLVLKKSAQGESMAWLTDLVSGQQVEDQPVAFFVNGELRDGGVTGPAGVAAADLELSNDESWAPMVAVSGQPGDAEFAAVSSEWSQGIAVWDFGLNGGYGAENLRSYFYTDRPIYRPGQTVYWKGIIRTLDDDQLGLPPQSLMVNVAARDDRGNAVYQQSLTPNANGTVNGEFILAPEAFSGFYYLDVQIPLGPEQTAYAGASFQVASYRKPEFQIDVTTTQPEYVQGETVGFDTQAAYFSGGALADAPLTWRVIAEPYTFYWQEAPAGRFFSFDAYDPAEDDVDGYGVYYGGLIQEGEGVTDEQGQFSLDLPADLSDSPLSQRWRLDVTVQSPTNQFVSGDASAPVHKAGFYIGQSPQSYVVGLGDEATVDLVTLTPDAVPYPGATLEAVVYEFEWNSVYEQAADGAFYWQTSVERTPVMTTSVTTDRQGQAQITWTPESGGQYQIKTSGEDDLGNQVSSVAYLWVAGSDYVAWPRENNDRIELIADQDLYAPGDVARLLVPSPFSGPVLAWLTLERAGVIESQLITLDGNSQTLEIPITAEHIPNIFVSLVLVKGIDETNPTPAMRIGYVQLNVDTAEKELAIDIAPSADELRPGDTVSYTLTIIDHAGQPVPDTEVSVALVDKAILSLNSGDQRSLLDVFYYQQPLGVNTSALLVINEDRASQQLSEGAKGGGGGGGELQLEVREDFPDSAYWRATLVSDKHGQVRFAVPLPDNLTTWHLVAKAVTQQTQVGDGANDVVASKALQIRPLLPRFFTSGDRAKIGASLLNSSDQAIDDGQLTLLLEGATLEGNQSAQVDFELEAGGQLVQSWPIAVNADSNVVTVTLLADSSTAADALRVALPVYRYETPETVASSGVVDPEEGRVEVVYLLDGATDSGELLVTMEPSLAAGLVDGLGYLEHYPYECNEQTVSRFLPNLLTVRALRALEIDDRQLESDLSYQLGVGVQRLVSRQNGDGGWGYWSGEGSSPFVSSYVLWGLASAEEMGFPIPELTIASAVDYLYRQFQAPNDVADDWQLNEMAFMQFVLSEMGKGDPGRASTLYDVRERLGLYGQAFLAMALDNMNDSGADDQRIETLLDDLFGQLEISGTGASWHEESVDWWTLNTDTRTTGIVLAAFLRLRPEQPTLTNVVRWLMSNRSGGRWATTQENAWSIIALTDWLRVSGELDADYDWTTTLNGATLGSGQVNAANLTEQVELRTTVTDLLADQANVLRFERSDGPGKLYYTTHLRYYLDALAVDARDRGIVVDRRFEVDGERSNRAAVGDVVSVTVSIIAPTDRYHLLVEVPLPAGLEPIDTSLATTSSAFEGPQFAPVDDPNIPQEWWRYWLPTSTDIRDEKVALFATYLPAGTYQYSFQARASLPGEYRVLPVYAEQMYFPEVWGRSAGELF